MGALFFHHLFELKHCQVKMNTKKSYYKFSIYEFDF